MRICCYLLNSIIFIIQNYIYINISKNKKISYIIYQPNKKILLIIQSSAAMSKKPAQKVQKRIKDPVSQMKIHRESLKKQKICEKVYEDFKINQPQKINFYAQKPNNNPFLLMKYQNQGKTINGVDISQKLNDDLQKSNLTDQINQKLKTVTHVPKDKWNVPQTTNQQIGWFVQHANQDKKFTFKRQGCNQTHYADGYYTMKHKSLFSNHNQK